MTNENKKAVHPEVSLSFTMQVDELVLQVGKKILLYDNPAVNIHIDPKMTDPANQIEIPLSALTAAVEELNRFWREYCPLEEPKETTTSEENREETN